MFGNHPAFEVTSVERCPAIAGYLHLLRNTFLQSGSRHNDLEHGSWGKLRLNGFVEERVIIIIDQLRPFILFYAHRKVVRSEERRVGKECRSGRSQDQLKEK